MIPSVLVAFLALGFAVLAPAGASAAPVVLNEYNAVDDALYLDAPEASDPVWGRRPGNGGDWFEVVVVEDHVDLRGWEFVVRNDSGGASEESFLLKLSTNAVWADLRRGTLVTFSEELENNASDYQPAAGRWWLNVRAAPDTGGTYVAVTCIAPACDPATANWKVSNNNWQLTIRNAASATVYGPAGEGVSPASGVGSGEVFKLESTPTAATTPLANYQDGTSSSFGQPNRYAAGTMVQDFSTLRSVVPYEPLVDVRINEVATHTDPGVDWVELHNVTDHDVDLSGWFLSDRFDQLDQWEFPSGAMIEAGGYLVIDEATMGFAFRSACGEAAILSAGDGLAPTGPRDFLEFGPAETGMTMGRYPEPSGDMHRLLDGTPGSGNVPERTGPVVLNEIHYHPADPVLPSTLDAEFIELRNLTSSAVALTTDYGADGVRPWKISGGVDFEFATGTVVPADGFLVVTSFDPAIDTAHLAELRATFSIPPSVPIVGPYAGRLSNLRDTVRLKRPDTPEADGDICGGIGNPTPYVPYVVVDEVTYGDNGEWPVEADGSGASLERVNAMAASDDAANWEANRLATATPGRSNSVFGAMNSAQQKCANALNRAFAKVAKAGADTAYSCLRLAEASALPFGSDFEGCLALDGDGRIAKASASTLASFASSCPDLVPIAPVPGSFGPDAPESVIDAASKVAESVLHDTFGDDLDQALVLSQTDSALANCQRTVARAIFKCADVRYKVFNDCKKAGLRGGTFFEERDLAACIAADPYGKTTTACGATAGRVHLAVTSACTLVGVALEDAFPACATASAADVAACVERSTACRACLAWNAADDLRKDCDPIDDGLDNDTCP